MSTTSKLTSKCQVTIPKRIRETLGLGPGSRVDFLVNEQGRIEIRNAGGSKARPTRRSDRFERARGSATIKGRTDDLMKLLRGD